MIKSDWSSGFSGGYVGMRHHWKILDDGTLKATIEEYAGDPQNKTERKYHRLLDRKEIIVQDFAPVVWQVKNIKDQRFIVRFVPSLREVSAPLAVDSLPVAGRGIMISDSEGYLWAQDVKFNGKYSGVTSHRGTLVISYVPFKGATDAGIAEGDLITLTFSKNFVIKLKATTSFLPAGVTAKVYAAYKPGKKSGSFHSLHTFDTKQEELALEILAQ